MDTGAETGLETWRADAKQQTRVVSSVLNVFSSLVSIDMCLIWLWVPHKPFVLKLPISQIGVVMCQFSGRHSAQQYANCL